MDANFVEPIAIEKLMDTTVLSPHESFGLEFTRSRSEVPKEILEWYEIDYKIYEMINDFWGLSANSKLIAVTKNIDDKAWKGLVSEWDTGTNLAGQFRVNKAMIKSLLQGSLGERAVETEGEFKLKEITQLEMTLFENFFVELENFWKDFWRVSIPEQYGTYTYLVWAVETDDGELGSIAIGVPPGISPANLVEKGSVNFREAATQLEVEIPLDLTVGSSRVKISEVKSLEKGDLIVFEESNLNQLIWNKNEIEKMCINLSLPGKDNSRFTSMYYDGLEISDMIEEQNSSEDLLTDLPVELTAQFKSVHMPLKKIIELESGGILPLGLLMDSQLTLTAPGGKAIASGNLVIVGNQFGIRIDKTNIKANRYPAAKLNYDALEQEPAVNEQAATQMPAEQEMMPIEEQPVAQQENLDQELQDMGIDPQELDDLEDLY